MLIGRRPIRAAVSGSFMVADPEREPLAGAKLLRALVHGPQDVTISESANPLSQKLWGHLGGRLQPGYSLDWFRILRPASLGASLAAGRFARFAPLRRTAAGGDWLGDRLTAGFFAVPQPRFAARDADEAELAEAIRALSPRWSLRPDWVACDLGRRLAHAGRKERYGSPVRRIVTDRKGALAGCYLVYGRPGALAWVMQILARGGDEGAVIDCLFADAAEAGAGGVRGRATPALLGALMERRCFFAHRAATIVVPTDADAEAAAAVQSGSAWITGLAAEAWCRLIGGDFTAETARPAALAAGLAGDPSSGSPRWGDRQFRGAELKRAGGSRH